MSDSTSLLTQITTSQSGKEITVNELFNALSKTAFGGRKQSSSGLSWDYFGGRIRVDGVSVAIPNGTLALTASATNYVECTRAGVFSKNTTAFTPGSIALYSVVTGASTVTSYQDHRPFLTLGPQRLVYTFAADADITLNYYEADCQFLNFGSAVSLTATRNVILPLAVKQYNVWNGTQGAQSLQFIGATGTGVTVGNEKRAIISADGTNIVRVTADQ